MESADQREIRVVENLQRVALTVAQVGESQSRAVEAQTESSMEKIPFKVATYQTGLTCRFVESAEAILTVFKARQYAAAISLTQSVIMTTAALWQLYQRVDSAIRREDTRDLEIYLHQIFTGASRERSTYTFETATVMGFIQRADNDFPMFQQHCEELLRFDRPEWFGTGQLYAKNERTPEEHSMEFRRHLSRGDKAVVLMSEVLHLTALAYQHFSKELDRIMPRLRYLAEGSARDLPINVIELPGTVIAGSSRRSD